MQRQKTMKHLFFSSITVCLLLLPLLAAAQDKVPEKNPLGFRSDFGLEATIGGHVCATGGGNGTQIECQGNDKGWDMGTGVAVAGRVRPLKFFSIGLELSYMGLRPSDASTTDRLFKRFFDFSVGPVFKFHVPIRIKTILMDLTFGLKTAFVNGYLYAKPDTEIQAAIGEDSKYYRHRLFGPEISGVVGLDLYVIPKFGFGVEFRPMATMYQTICFDEGADQICRGTDDDPRPENNFDTPFKLVFGLHLIYFI